MVLDTEVLESVKGMSEDDSIYTKLSKSIAPEIYGMLDVKKAILLLMVGG